MSSIQEEDNCSTVMVESLCRHLPCDRSLHMPAEWAAHASCIILFPHNSQTFRLDRAQREVLLVADAIARHGQELVFLLVRDEAQAQQVQKEPIVLSHGAEQMIRVEICPSNDTWVRDTGPTCVITGGGLGLNNESRQVVLGLDWGFNAYGGPDEGCYWPCDLDTKIANRVCKDLLYISSFKIDMILEGGSIHTDGEGTLLVTAECLLHQNRNPKMSQKTIEGVLRRCLGVKVIIWLPFGLDADEDTNGHVDNFCCFVQPGHVALAWTDDIAHDKENYERCRQASGILSSTLDTKGRAIQVHKLHLPPPLVYSCDEADSLRGVDDAVERQAGERMAASYVNFYIANQAVIVPQFGAQSTDGQAIQTLQALFPNRSVVGVPSREILLGGGNIHCITQQIPAL